MSIAIITIHTILSIDKIASSNNRKKKAPRKRCNTFKGALVIAGITTDEAGFDIRKHILVTALYICGTFTNKNTLAIRLNSYHVTGLDADGKQVANSECDNSGGGFTGSLASGGTTTFKAELFDAKKEIRFLKVDLN